MPIKYLFIDDESLHSLQLYTGAVEGISDELTIDIKHPASYSLNISGLIDLLRNYDGLILDWRLDEYGQGETNDKFPFRAAALAQEIRTFETEGKEITGLPIVLWSTKLKLTQSYYGNETAQDLFDCSYSKDDISESPDHIRQELIALVNGYRAIGEKLSLDHDSLDHILGVASSDLDIRLLRRFSNGPFPAHEYALFILRELINRPGPLIDEKLLAARLGVDIENSLDWEHLKDILPRESKYQGPFNDAWSRWWIHYIEQVWWQNLDENLPPLSVLPAQKRIEILKENANMRGLVASNPIRDNYGTKFYTLCEYYLKPLDPIDGVIIDENEPAPWQTRRYLSIDAALERLGEPKTKPHPTEIERVHQIREIRKKDAQR